MKARVPLYGKPQGYVQVDTEATKGATLGTNLYWSTGDLISEAALVAAIAAGTAAAAAAEPTAAGTDLLPTTWAYLLNVPPNVVALEEAVGTGLFAVTGTGTGAFRTLTAPAAGFTIANAGGVAGNPAFTLANDLAALEGLGGTGFAVRTASDTWAQRTLTGTADRLSITAGDGVSGNPTIDIAATYAGQASITTLGTIATGTWQGTAVGLAYGGTGQNYSTRVANTVWAGPTTGADAAPTFRALVAADIPSLSSIYQPLDATLTALAAADWAANAFPIGTGADTVAQVAFAANTFPARASTGDLVAKSITDFGLSLVDDADASAARATLGLVIGTNVQAYDAELAALASTTSAADALPYFTGAGTATTTTLTSYARTLLDDTTAGAARTTLGATTVGGNIFTLTNPSAITFPRINADNTVTARTASELRTDLSLVVGTNVQAWDTTLDTVAAWALTGTADNTTVLVGSGVFQSWINGAWGVGTSSLSGYNMRIRRNPSGGTSYFGLSSEGVIQSAVTSSHQYFYSYAETAAAAFTLNDLRHFYAGQGTFGASSTVTTQYGFAISTSMTGATNNWGFVGSLAAATGRKNFNATGTADNTYAGNSKFGSTSAPAAKVDIAAGTATAGTAPLKFTSGTVLTAAEAGVMEYDNSLRFTQSDATRRYVVQATNATKTTAGAPYANDGYITVRIGGTDVKVMTTA